MFPNTRVARLCFTSPVGWLPREDTQNSAYLEFPKRALLVHFILILKFRSVGEFSCPRASWAHKGRRSTTFGIKTPCVTGASGVFVKWGPPKLAGVFLLKKSLLAYSLARRSLRISISCRSPVSQTLPSPPAAAARTYCSSSSIACRCSSFQAPNPWPAPHGPSAYR
jgi:hypothetical protein